MTVARQFMRIHHDRGGMRCNREGHTACAFTVRKWLVFPCAALVFDFFMRFFSRERLAKNFGLFNSRCMRGVSRIQERKRNAPGTFELRQSPGYLLRRCHQRSRQIFDELIGFETGLSRQQLALLIGIDGHPQATQAALSEATGFDRNTLAELMNRLIDKHLVERRRAQNDARAYEVTLSARGASIVRRMYPRYRRVQEEILAPLPRSLRPKFLECLEMLSATVTEDSPRRGGRSSAKHSRRS
jgi:DNA-binding MarR family transcriptional regulator